MSLFDLPQDDETPPSVSSPVPVAPLDLSNRQGLHVVGIGGPGMSAIGIALAEMGHDVSGSDLRDRAVLDRVRASGASVHIGHDRELVHGVDAVTASTAVPDLNIELDEARQVGITVLRRAGMLASICAQAKSLAVAGTHGKTTTTSMLMLMLAEANLRPSFIIGGDVTDIGTGAHWSGSEWLVVEADESDGTHVELPLYGTILTNVEVDHLDHHGSFDGIKNSFDRYLAQVPGPKVVPSWAVQFTPKNGEVDATDQVPAAVSRVPVTSLNEPTKAPAGERMLNVALLMSAACRLAAPAANATAVAITDFLIIWMLLKFFLI